MTANLLDDTLPEHLNEPQRAAVLHRDGPLLVYAGAGSGKTMVISHSIAHLVQTGVPASSILAVTFTNKAAKELRERVERLVGLRARNMVVSTFHSACVRFLRVYAAEIGYSSAFSIYDDSEKTAVLKGVIKDTANAANIFTPAILENKLDRIKNSGLTPGAYGAKIEHDFANRESLFKRYGEREQHELVLKCYQLYQERMKQQNAMDFNDLILETVGMFEKKPHVLAELQTRFRYFLVDEFQDTNPIQFRLITMLSEKTRNLRVVGDDDQSIYSWRGAEPGFILDFNKHYPDATVVKLEENYRSTGAIIQAASHVIANNRKRAPKTLWTNKEFGERVHMKVAHNVHDEADFLVRNILKGIENGHRLSEYAILYRTNNQSRVIEDGLRRHMVPYVIYGSVRFYERAEIKVLLAYLRLLVNPNDDVSFRKVISTPKRGFGDKALQKLDEVAQTNNLSLLRTALGVARNELVVEVSRGLSGLKSFANAFITWYRMLHEEKLPPSEVFDRLLVDIEFQKYLTVNYPEDFDERWLNVVELKNALTDFEQKTTESLATQTERDPFSDTLPSSRETILADFLQQAMLVVEPTSQDVATGNADAVTLMTIHSAKGLEFDRVFLAGLEEGSLPHQRSLDDPFGIEEERRLMYVAMTRARRVLTISRCRDDIYRHERKTPSRFLSEIPGDCLDFVDRPAGFTPSYNSSRELRYVRED
jgi:DNA helicase-2/ATP-dependent DNA helicase PcrA